MNVRGALLLPLLPLSACASDPDHPATAGRIDHPPSSSDARKPIGEAEARTIHSIQRIRTLNPSLNAVIAIDPSALDQARRIDALGRSGPVAGRPVLIKDNVETLGVLPTTAGSSR